MEAPQTIDKCTKALYNGPCRCHETTAKSVPSRKAGPMNSIVTNIILALCIDSGVPGFRLRDAGAGGGAIGWSLPGSGIT
jgi:hypothetical protein